MLKISKVTREFFSKFYFCKMCWKKSGILRPILRFFSDSADILSLFYGKTFLFFKINSKLGIFLVNYWDKIFFWERSKIFYMLRHYEILQIFVQKFSFFINFEIFANVELAL